MANEEGVHAGQMMPPPTVMKEAASLIQNPKLDSGAY
jgi:hypothetical protein